MGFATAGSVAKESEDVNVYSSYVANFLSNASWNVHSFEQKEFEREVKSGIISSSLSPMSREDTKCAKCRSTSSTCGFWISSDAIVRERTAARRYELHTASGEHNERFVRCCA